MKKFNTFTENIDRHIKNRNLKKGIKDIKKMDKYMGAANLSTDIVIQYLRDTYRFFRSFRQVDKQIQSLKQLASFSIDVGSMQTTYRTIEEAIEIAQEHHKIKDVIELYELLLVACYKDGDLDGALACYEAVQDITQQVGIRLKDSTLLNIGTIYIAKDRCAEASPIFSKLISSSDVRLSFVSKVNLAICHRKENKLNKSLALLDEIVCPVGGDVDHLIEYELVYAKSLIENGDYKESIIRINNAIYHMENSMDCVIKLYYRRGVREKYVFRLERLILTIPEEELNQDILQIISFTRSNQTSDWLYILDWCDELYEQEIISEKETLNLKESIKNVAENGAPYLFGMLEKYDDHHIHPDAWRWDELTKSINSIVKKYNVNKPLDKSSVKYLSEIFKERIATNSVVISFIHIASKIMIIHKDKFEIIPLDKGMVSNHILDISKYKVEEISSKIFAPKVDFVQSKIFEAMEDSLVHIDKLHVKGLIYIPDRYGFFPVTSTALLNLSLRKKMKEGAFVLRSVPVMFPKNKQKCVKDYQKILGVFEPSSLQLSKLEIENVQDNLNINCLSLLEPNVDKANFKKEMSNTDILHVTTHGSPIDFYVDPFFADLGENHPISTCNIQSFFYNLNYSLVFLNSCHSSSDLKRKTISLTGANPELNCINSYDTFSFPVVLLLNRKSYNIASSWKTFDKYSYILSHNISNNLVLNNDIEVSFSKSLATMTDMTEQTIEKNLSKSNQEQNRLLENKKSTVQMLSHPYSYSTYQLYSLL